MPKLPRFKQNVRISAPSPIQALSPRTAGLSGRDKQALGQGLSNLGGSVNQIARIKAQQDTKIFAIDQKVLLEDRFLNSFRDASDENSGASEDGSNYEARFLADTKNTVDELDSISDPLIKSNLLSHANTLSAKYSGKLRASGLASQNRFNLNKYENTIGLLSGHVASNPSLLTSSIEIAQEAATAHLGLTDQVARQATIDKSVNRLIHSAVNGIIAPKTKESFQQAREELDSDFIKENYDPFSRQKLIDEIDQRDLKRVSEYITRERQSDFLSDLKRKRLSAKAVEVESARFDAATTQEEKDFVLDNAFNNKGYPIELRRKIDKILRADNAIESEFQTEIILRDLYFNGDPERVRQSIPENFSLIPADRKKIAQELITFSKGRGDIEKTVEGKNAIRSIKAHFGAGASFGSGGFSFGSNSDNTKAAHALEIFTKNIISGMSIEEAKFSAIARVDEPAEFNIPELDPSKHSDLKSTGETLENLGRKYKKLIKERADPALISEVRSVLIMLKSKQRAFIGRAARDDIFKRNVLPPSKKKGK